MMRLFLLLNLIFAFSFSVFAQQDVTQTLEKLAEDRIVVITFIPTEEYAKQELQESIIDGTILLSFEPTAESDLKLKSPVTVETTIENANTNYADFEDMSGVIELRCLYTSEDNAFRFEGNLSLVTLKGIGNFGIAE